MWSQREGDVEIGTLSPHYQQKASSSGLHLDHKPESASQAFSNFGCVLHSVLPSVYQKPLPSPDDQSITATDLLKSHARRTLYSSSDGVNKVKLTRPTLADKLDFSICGDNHLGIYVSRVDSGSSSERAGLRPGDQILAANCISFLNVGRDEALRILRSNKEIDLVVLPRSQALSPVHLHHSYTWTDLDGRPVSPPPVFRYYDFTYDQLVHSKKISRRITTEKVRPVIINVPKGQSLGLTIRGGLEYGLGIYITSVDENSAAASSGLQVGDQILSVNGRDFLSIMHDEAVDVLKSSPRIRMRVRSVGKIPHSSTNFQGRQWYAEEPRQIPSSRLSSRGSSPRRREPSPAKLELFPPSSVADKNEEILDEKALVFLTENERMTFDYYRNEYETKAMTIDAFVAVLCELFDDPQKYTLMNEIRGIIKDEDLDKFDELIFQREDQVMRAKEAMRYGAIDVPQNTDNEDIRLLTSSPQAESPRSPRGSMRSPASRRKAAESHRLTVPDLMIAGSRNAGDTIDPSGLRTPSEDSGVDLANGAFLLHSARRNSRVMRELSEGISAPQQHNPAMKLQRSALGRHSFTTTPRESSMSSAVMRRMMLRRHSSGGETLPPRSHDRRGATLQYPIPDDRRWSIAAHAMAPNNCEPLEHRPPSRQLHHSSPTRPDYEESAALLSAAESRHDQHEHDQQQQMRDPSPTTSNYLDVPNIATRVRRHRSLPDPHAIRGRRRHQQQEHSQHRSASVRIPGHRAIPEGDGKLRVIVKKTRPFLGIAIEGGVNTAQPLPRIISIHATGAAFEAGSLKVGHIILEVDGMKTAKLKHQEVAKAIADSYYNSDRDHVEFLVTEKAKTPLDLGRTSLTADE